MPADCRPYLDTVVTVVCPDGESQQSRLGTGFFCRATHWHNAARQLLFLVTSGHVVGSDPERVEVIFQPRAGDQLLADSLTGRIGPGPSTWFVDRDNDLAALLLDPERLPEDQIRYRSFDVKTDLLSLRQLRQRQIAEGDEALVVGFAQPTYESGREYPAVRLATIAAVPNRARPEWPLLAEGTALPGDSGSPVIVKPEWDSRISQHAEAGGKLIGVLDGAGRPATVTRSDDDGTPIEVEQRPGIVRVVPADALYDLISYAVGNTILAETFGPMFRKVRGWMRGRGRAE